MWAFAQCAATNISYTKEKRREKADRSRDKEG